MLRAIDIANFFIDLYKNFEEDNDLTNMKINKLLYYSQGHSYERFGRPLFNDDIEAWSNGPVVNGVYQNLKKYERNTIMSTIGDYDPSKFTEEETELLLDIAREYGKYSTVTLRNMTHEPGLPWESCFDGSFHKIIPQDIIADHFMNGNKLPTFAVEQSIDTIGRVENGRIVIPTEELDDWDY